MVFFTCNGCGSSLKKNQVEKHRMTQCRNSQHLSCMDCCKDFYGNEYQTHTKCISEEEKYGAKGWTPRPNQNKNERKQQEWVTLVQEVSANNKLEPGVQSLLQTISLHENVPRKKPKFMNFLKNVSRNKFHPKQAEQAWDLISKALEKKKTENAPKVESATNGRTEENGNVESEEQEDEEKSKKSQKRKHAEENERSEDNVPENDENSLQPKKKKKKSTTADKTEDADAVHEAEESSAADNSDRTDAAETKKFKWSSVTKTVLRSQDDKEMSLKKLKKKVVNEYQSKVGNSKGEKTAEELWAQCLRKLSKNPKFKIHKERIKLVE